jgi:hypothetical protein
MTGIAQPKQNFATPHFCKIATIQAALLFCLSGAGAASTVVTGKAVADTGAPLALASVLCFDGARRLMVTPIPAQLTGDFRVVLAAFNGLSLICEISAPTFTTRRVTLLVEQGLAQAGVVQLRRSITMNEFHISTSGMRDKSVIEALLHNRTSQPTQVIALELQATRREKTDCLDLRPLHYCLAF